jgi:cysteine synthase B
MPANVTHERRQLLAIYGANIIESPAELGSNGAVALARRLVAEDARYVMPDQYANPMNPRAHYDTTGPEILADCPELEVFVAGLGTGGTLMGVGRRLREERPGVKIYAAEPMPGEMVQGLRSLDDGYVPEIFDPSMLDGSSSYRPPNRSRRCAS